MEKHLALIVIFFVLPSCTEHNHYNVTEIISTERNGLEKSANSNLANALYIFMKDRKGGVIDSGTGAAAGTNGLVLTANHITESPDVDEIFVRIIEDEKYIIKKVSKVTRDRLRDIAVLKIDYKFKTKIKPRKNKMKKGEGVLILGYPLAEYEQDIYSSTPDISYGDFFKYDREKLPYPKEAIEIMLLTAPTAPGSSGSPVFDRNGGFLGIAKSARKFSPNGFSFSTVVPVKYCEKLLSQAGK